MAVSAVKQDPMVLAPSSNYGPQIDIAAGGDGIVTLNPAGNIVTVNGTSFAAPFVTAAMALLIDQKLALEGCKPFPWELKNAIKNSAQAPDGTFDPNKYGAGVLDINAALNSSWIEDPCLDPGPGGLF